MKELANHISKLVIESCFTESENEETRAKTQSTLSSDKYKNTFSLLLGVFARENF